MISIGNPSVQWLWAPARPWAVTLTHWVPACSWVFNLRSQKGGLVSKCHTLLCDTANKICFQEENLQPSLLYSPSSRFLCFLSSQFPPCVLSNYSFFSHSSTSPSIRTPSILYTFTYVCLFIYVHLYTCNGNHLPSSKFFPLSNQ